MNKTINKMQNGDFMIEKDIEDCAARALRLEAENAELVNTLKGLELWFGDLFVVEFGKNGMSDAAEELNYRHGLIRETIKRAEANHDTRK